MADDRPCQVFFILTTVLVGASQEYCGSMRSTLPVSPPISLTIMLEQPPGVPVSSTWELPAHVSQPCALSSPSSSPVFFPARDVIILRTPSQEAPIIIETRTRALSSYPMSIRSRAVRMIVSASTPLIPQVPSGLNKSGPSLKRWVPKALERTSTLDCLLGGAPRH